MTNNTKRDLALIAKTASTTRVLNLLAVYERSGETEACKQHPMFLNRRLNRSIIMKHSLRGGEATSFREKRVVATKVILPFAPSNLTQGGLSFFVGQTNFVSQLREAVGGYAQDSDLEADVAVLNAFDSLPSLDPFLLREMLKRLGRAPARCYFDISGADSAHMHDYVSCEMAKLAQLLASKLPTPPAELAQKLADCIFFDENNELVAPLMELLEQSGEAYHEGTFAWKGFLYYKWALADQRLKSERAMKEMASAIIARESAAMTDRVNQSRARIKRMTDQSLAMAQNALGTYDRAFDDLTVKQRPQAFREFLLHAPALFQVIGTRLASVAHITSYWRFRFPSAGDLRLQPREAIDVFQNLEYDLSAGENKPVAAAGR